MEEGLSHNEACAVPRRGPGKPSAGTKDRDHGRQLVRPDWEVAAGVGPGTVDGRVMGQFSRAQDQFFATESHWRERVVAGLSPMA